MVLLGRVVRVNNLLGKIVSEVADSVDVLLMDTETNDYVKKNYKISEIEIDEDLRDLTIEEFVTELDDGYYLDDKIEEIKLLGDMGGSETLLNEVMRYVIKAKNVYIKDLVDFDYDVYFSERIKNYRQ
jgi:hypothetical protein